jgi:hypothetical protein
LVDREVGIPDHLEGTGRWSLDHLFIDQDAIPTLVEVKRASDSRLRREWVGQMLDYAANGSRHWPAALLRGRWEGWLQEDNPDDVIKEFAGVDADEFWGRVSENLRDGRVRMLFVSDDIPTELQTVIEYLNEQMDSAEVLGVSISRYAGHDLSVLVPRVVGSSARAQQAKQVTIGKSYREYVEEAGEPAMNMERLLLELSQEYGMKTRRSRTALILEGAGDHAVLAFYPGSKTVQLSLDPLRQLGFDSLVADAFEQATRISTRGLTEKYPGIPIDDAIRNWGDLRALVIRLATVEHK